MLLSAARVFWPCPAYFQVSEVARQFGLSISEDLLQIHRRSARLNQVVARRAQPVEFRVHLPERLLKVALQLEAVEHGPIEAIAHVHHAGPDCGCLDLAPDSGSAARKRLEG